VVTQGGLPVQRACDAIGLGRATYYRPLVDWARRDAPMIAALTTLVAAKSRWGFWKCCDRLRLDGHGCNHKRLWRVYYQLRLHLPRRTKKRLPVRLRQPLVVIPQPNAVWAVDFMSDTLYGVRRFRTLNILDGGVREGLAIEIDTSLPAERVIRVLEQVVSGRGQLRRFGSTMARNSSPSSSSPGVRNGRFSCGTSNRASRVRMRSPHPVPNISNRSAKCVSVRVVGTEINVEWWQSYNEERPHHALAACRPPRIRQN